MKFLFHNRIYTSTADRTILDDFPSVEYGNFLIDDKSETDETESFSQEDESSISESSISKSESRITEEMMWSLASLISEEEATMSQREEESSEEFDNVGWHPYPRSAEYKAAIDEFVA